MHLSRLTTYWIDSSWVDSNLTLNHFESIQVAKFLKILSFSNSDMLWIGAKWWFKFRYHSNKFNIDQQTILVQASTQLQLEYKQACKIRHKLEDSKQKDESRSM